MSSQKLGKLHGISRMVVLKTYGKLYLATLYDVLRDWQMSFQVVLAD